MTGFLPSSLVQSECGHGPGAAAGALPIPPVTPVHARAAFGNQHDRNSEAGQPPDGSGGASIKIRARAIMNFYLVVNPTRQKQLTPDCMYSKGDAETVRYACSLLPEGGTVRFIHVCPTVLPALQPALAARLPADKSRFGADVTLEAEESLLDLIPESVQILKIKIESEVLVHTDLAQAILEAADVFGADAICVGSPSRSRLGAAVLGSVTHAVMNKAHQPVVVVPHAGG